MRNGHYPLPPLRPELQAAYDEMNAKEDYFAYAVCRTYDGQAWEVNTRQGGMCFALDGRHIDHDEAIAAGAAWLLEQLNREPTAAEAAYRALWENMPVPVSRHRRPSRNENDVLHAPYTGRMNHMMPPDAIPCPLSAVALPYLEGKIPAGFPSPADDFQVERLELLELLTPHPLTTFFWRVGGTSMAEAGISDGDILVVDRALQASHGDVVVAQVDNDFTVKYLHQKAGKVKLVPANPTFPEIVPKDGQTWFVVGVVTSVVKQFRKLA